MSSALLFDLDGTLVDTTGASPPSSASPRCGVALDCARYISEIMGASNDTIGSTFLPHLKLAERAGVLDAKEAARRAEVSVVVPEMSVNKEDHRLLSFPRLGSNGLGN